MKARFKGDGNRHLIDALKRQEFIAGDTDLAAEIVAHGELLEFRKGENSSSRLISTRRSGRLESGKR